MPPYSGQGGKLERHFVPSSIAAHSSGAAADSRAFRTRKSAHTGRSAGAIAALSPFTGVHKRATGGCCLKIVCKVQRALTYVIQPGAIRMHEVPAHRIGVSKTPAAPRIQLEAATHILYLRQVGLGRHPGVVIRVESTGFQQRLCALHEVRSREGSMGSDWMHRWAWVRKAQVPMGGQAMGGHGGVILGSETLEWLPRRARVQW